MKKENKVVVSFATTPEVKRRLQKRARYTQFIEAIVIRGLEQCPTCGAKVHGEKKTEER